MKVSELRSILNNLADDEEVYIRNSRNPLGNITELEQVELSTYGFFGKSIPCIILNTYYNVPESEIDKEGDDAIISLKNSRESEI